jgi:hypothetical protein
MEKKIFRLAGALLALAFCNSTAVAAPATLHYSTFLHSGPGETFAVLGEVEHDTALDVGACQGGWCKVTLGSKTGYVDRGALFLTDPVPGSAPRARNGCFTTGPSTTAGPEPRRFCETAKAGPGPAP